MALIDDIRGALVVGNAPQVSELTQKALDEGTTALEILNNGLVAGKRAQRATNASERTG